MTKHDEASNHISRTVCNDSQAASVRVSRLAIASLVSGVLCCPCILAVPLDALMKHVSQFTVNRHVNAWMHKWAVLILMVLLTAVPVAAIVNIHRANGRRSGMLFALVGLMLSIGWWILVILVRFVWQPWVVMPG